MKFEEARQRLIKLLCDNDDKRDKFLSDFMADKELSPQDKFIILCETSYCQNHYGWHLGMYIAKDNSRGTIKKYCELLSGLLEQGIPARDIYNLLAKKGRNTGNPYNFCMNIAAIYDDDALQYFLNLLLKLNIKQISVEDIFLLLNMGVSDHYSRFFDYLPGRFDVSILVNLLKSELTKYISFEQILHNPQVFLDQLLKSRVEINLLLKQLPSKFFDEDLNLLKFIIETYSQLRSRKFARFTIPHDQLTTNSFVQHIKSNISSNLAVKYLLLLFDACLNLPEFNKKVKFDILCFECELTDDTLVPVLANIFKYANKICFESCNISQQFMSILKVSRSVAGSDFNIKEISIHGTVKVDRTVFNDLMTWLTVNYVNKITVYEKYNPNYIELFHLGGNFPSAIHINGIHTNAAIAQLLQSIAPIYSKKVILNSAYVDDTSISDPHVIELHLNNSTMTTSMFINDSFLKFLNGMRWLVFLRLSGIIFQDIKTRLMCFEQISRKPELKSIVINFPVSDPDLDSILTLVKNNANLTYLWLRKANFDNKALIKLADVLRESNRTLTKLLLKSQERLPAILQEVLDRNNAKDELEKTRETVEKILADLNSFARSNNNDNSDAVLMGHWNAMFIAYLHSKELKSRYYPSPSSATLLCEKVATGFSVLLEQVYLKAQDTNIYRIKIFETVALLNSLYPYLLHAGSCTVFYDNLITICTAFFKTEDFSIVDNAISCLREDLINHLRRVLDENPVLYSQMCNLLYLLYKHKILTLIEFNNSANLLLLKNDIQLSTDIIGLLRSLNDFQGHVSWVTRMITKDNIISNLKSICVELEVINKRMQGLSPVSKGLIQPRYAPGAEIPMMPLSSATRVSHSHQQRDKAEKEKGLSYENDETSDISEKHAKSAKNVKDNASVISASKLMREMSALASPVLSKPPASRRVGNIIDCDSPIHSARGLNNYL